MIKHSFVSRSAKPSKALKKAVLPVVRNVVSFRDIDLVVWIGNDPNKLFENCFDVKTKNIDKIIDISGIIKAKFLAVCYVEILLPNMIRLINFACEYGVPIVWVGATSSPQRRHWNITMQLKKPSFFAFWELVWPLIK